MSGTDKNSLTKLPHAAWHNLIGRKRWVLWKWEAPLQGGNPTKRAYDLRGQRTSTKNDFAYFGTLDEILRFGNQHPKGSWDGIGYVPDGTEGLVFIDIDDCRDKVSGALSQGAADLITACVSYTEITPSGGGLRIIGTSAWPPGGRGKRIWTLPDGTHGEMYHHVNFVTVTLNRLSGTPDQFNRIDHVVGGLMPAANTIEEEDFGVERDPTAPLEILEETLNALPNSVNNWEFFNNVGMACFRACGGDYAGLEVWRGWSAKCETHSDAECDARWANYQISPPDALGFGSIMYWAREANKAIGWEGGPLWLRENRGPEAIGECPFPALPIENMSPGVNVVNGQVPANLNIPNGRVSVPEFSDEDLARKYADRYIGDARYVKNWGWYIWKDTHWRMDDKNEIFTRARDICSIAANDKRQQSNSAKAAQAAAGLASATTVAAVERLARYDERLAISTEAWDRDPWLLNTPAGTIDLKTGQLRPPSQTDLITRVTNASLLIEDCEFWLSFLDDITQRDPEMIAYLQRMAGYCLTGDTTEHALFYLHGTGGNGKSTFLNALQDVLGLDNYAQTAPMDLLLSSGRSDHPTELARLRGTRLVIASENRRRAALE
jgi:hypothetical protein